MSEDEKRKLIEARTIFNTGGDSISQYSETTLRDERSAWAYALNKIRPLFSANNPKLNTKSFTDFAHQYGLLSYSNSIREKLAKTT